MNYNTKICDIADTFFAMVNFSKRELYKQFTKEEADLLCSAFINKSHTPNINSKTYFQDIINVNIMYNNPFQNSVDKENTFKLKVDNLTSFQCYFLLHLICEYYSKAATDSEDGNLTSKIKLKNSDVLTEVGTHTLIYEVTDDGNTITNNELKLVKCNKIEMISILKMKYEKY